MSSPPPRSHPGHTQGVTWPLKRSLVIMLYSSQRSTGWPAHGEGMDMGLWPAQPTSVFQDWHCGTRYRLRIMAAILGLCTFFEEEVLGPLGRAIY